jgi:hypothetical protein
MGCDRIAYGKPAAKADSWGTMAAMNSQSAPTVYSGVLLGESLRLDAVLDADGLRVKRLWRTAAGDPEAGQPSVWTFIEFEVESDATAAAASLRDVLDETGGWYCSFGSVDEMIVVFSGRVFRYPRGETSGRQEAEAYARSVGVPDAQLDWEDWK